MTTNCSSSPVANSITTTFLVLIATTVMFAMTTDAIEWLGLHRYDHEDRYWNTSADCRFEPNSRNLNPHFNDVTKLSPSAVSGGGGSRPTTRKSQRSKSILVRDQRQLCLHSLELMPAVVQAAHTTVQVCQRQFDDWRWNCSSILLAPKFTPDLTSGSREQAFVVALAAASLSSSIAKTCSLGMTSKCGCGGHVQSTHPIPDARSVAIPGKALSPGAQQFQWGGCGDDVAYGIEFGQRFGSSRWVQRAPSLKSLNDLHNQRVGRKILAGSLTTSCKCHGVSGSCALKTCWRALPNMDVVGGLIMDTYHDSAVEVTSLRTGNGSGGQRALSLVVTRTAKEITDNELSFYSLSPDYCLADRSVGAHGTHGRECKKDHLGSAGCRSMCCGRRYTTETVTVQYRCDCRYHWCCYVKCRLCTEQVEIHRCT